MLTSQNSSVDLLILGGGWTYTFLKPLLDSDEHRHKITYMATTRDGRDGTLRWSWDSEDDRNNDYDALPTAKTVVVVFPLKGKHKSRKLVEGYEQCHGKDVRWIQLGSTGIFDGGPTLKSQQPLSEKFEMAKANFKWTDCHSPYNVDNDRAIAEDELLSLRENAFVLNLCGLWGGQRDPANWFGRIAPSKEALAAKGSVHFVHGHDVARAIVAVHEAPPVALTSQTLDMGRNKHLKGRRYVVTDLRVYDWWDIASAWAASSANDLAAKDAGQWVLELMQEHDIRALPRTPQEIGRAMDSREFWETFKLTPSKGRWERARA
ncbi:hypothetical protein OIO90_001769 [Microbotryomycetes sp. JL221]|nr:hypothetical protein OIO90_001769 [Microbotryomycetes sp. JL221]